MTADCRHKTHATISVLAFIPDLFNGYYLESDSVSLLRFPFVLLNFDWLFFIDSVTLELLDENFSLNIQLGIIYWFNNFFNDFCSSFALSYLRLLVSQICHEQIFFKYIWKISLITLVWICIHGMWWGHVWWWDCVPNCAL